ncbi:MAG: aldehyde dehydrogenase [Acidobacteria bacterium]|nr:aldehyde dehydrogenase [Acidobacteriota bacterium]
MLHIPILRRGEPYRSVDTQLTVHHRTREPFVEISQANSGLIRRDLLRQAEMQAALAAVPVRDLVAICRRAAAHFMEDALPLGDSSQTPHDYIAQVSATTGLPYVMAGRNMRKIAGVLDRIEDVLGGLTRDVDLTVLDTGCAQSNGHALSFFPRGMSLGVVLPSNSPGVHSLWAPAIALKTPLILKPGSAEPWSPYRIIQALVRAGAPKEAFGYYPCDHAGAGEILRGCGRGMVFGDVSTTRLWANDPRIEVHGPGYSKIVIGEDQIDCWEEEIDVIVASILENSGRSCINASGVWVPRRGAEIAEALAQRLAEIVPKPAQDETARIAPFADPGVAARISAMIDDGLAQPGAEDVTARYRGGPRLVGFQGCAYLLPTIVNCASPEHTLANREYLFPFASVVECPQSELVRRIGPSLVVTALTEDPRLKRELLSSPEVGRLNFGPVCTMQISWDQPHEGNLFEHLWARRAFQAVAAG